MEIKGITSNVAHIIDATLKATLDIATKVVHAVQKFFYEACRFLVTKCTTLFAEHIITNDPYTHKIHKLRLEHEMISGNTKSAEACRFLSRFVSQMVDQRIGSYHEIEEELKPDWVKSILQEDGSFTITGEAIKTVVTKHPRLVAQTVEVNLLKASLRFLEKIDTFDSERPQMHLDFVKDAAKEATLHFAEMATGTQVQHDNINSETRRAASYMYYLLFPAGEKDLEIPGPKAVQDYLRPVIGKFLMNTAMPQLTGLLYETLTSPLVKDQLMIEGFQLLKSLINDAPKSLDVEADKTDFASVYLKQREFNKAIGDAFSHFLQFVDPFIHSHLFKIVSKEKIDEKFGSELADILQTTTLKECVHRGIEQLLPVLNEGGTWKKEGSNDIFVDSPIHFVKTKSEQQKELLNQERQAKQVHEKLKTLVASIGQETHGLLHVAKESFLDKTCVKVASNSSEQQSYFWQAVEKVQYGYQMCKEKAKAGLIALSVGPIGSRIQFLSKDALCKMQDVKHNQLLGSLALRAIRELCA